MIKKIFQAIDDKINDYLISRYPYLWNRNLIFDLLSLAVFIIVYFLIIGTFNIILAINPFFWIDSSVGYSGIILGTAIFYGLTYFLIIPKLFKQKRVKAYVLHDKYSFKQEVILLIMNYILQLHLLFFPIFLFQFFEKNLFYDSESITAKETYFNYLGGNKESVLVYNSHRPDNTIDSIDSKLFLGLDDSNLFNKRDSQRLIKILDESTVDEDTLNALRQIAYWSDPDYYFKKYDSISVPMILSMLDTMNLKVNFELPSWFKIDLESLEGNAKIKNQKNENILSFLSFFVFVHFVIGGFIFEYFSAVANGVYSSVWKILRYPIVLLLLILFLNFSFYALYQIFSVIDLEAYNNISEPIRSFLSKAYSKFEYLSLLICKFWFWFYLVFSIFYFLIGIPVKTFLINYYLEKLPEE